MVNRKRLTPIGIKIISIILIIPFMYLLSFYITTAKTLSASNSKKYQLIQLDKYKKLNINSVEEFNRFLRTEQKKSIHRLSFVGVIIAGLIFGLWRLKRWARIGVIIYSLIAIAWNVICLLPGTSVVKISKLPALIASLIIIFYLTRPKVKSLFH